MRRFAICLAIVGSVIVTVPAALGQARPSGRAPIETRAKDPYFGAIVVDADTGSVLFEDNADAPGYPASIVKLMDLLIIEERVAGGQLKLNDAVRVSADASRMGGSQVYLAEKESFPVEELLYALMIQSANDAAYALGEHVGGSAAGFVKLMNAKAAALGMRVTRFNTCHGLPPSVGGEPDVSSPRDLATLALAVLKYPQTIQYTATRERGFRNNTFIMRTHNNLLEAVEGCDGLKTGYFKAGGYSIVATAQRGGRRVVAVVMGSPSREVRDAKAGELIGAAFLNLPPLPPPPPPPPTNLPPAAVRESAARAPGAGWHVSRWVLMVAGALVLIGFGVGIGRRRGPGSN